MTNEEIQKAKESFLRMGVAEESIFSEIMRARYLDYNLFLNPTNAEYGVTIESLYENMKLTSDKFGDYTGNEDCLLYTSDASDEEDSEEFGGRSII